MGRVRVFVLLLSLLVLSGCFGLMGGTTTRLSGTVRIDTTSGAGEKFLAPQSVAAKFFGMPAGGAVFTPSIRMTESGPRQPVPVEVLLYADRLSAADARGLAEQHGFTYLRSSRDGYHVLRDRLGRSESRAISEIRGAAGGARVEPNRPLYPMAVNDPWFDEQWALQVINAVPAWNVAEWNGSEVVVAIVDTEIDFKHPDLNDPALWTQGRDFTDSKLPEGQPYGFDPNGPPVTETHGTMVAGIIAALTDNGEGVAGTVGPGANVKLMPIRVFGGENVDEETIARSIEWAVDNGADVINLSLGDKCENIDRCPQPEFRLGLALDYAWREGVAVVAAAGNYGGAVVMPANYDTTIAVGAVASNGAREGYSSFGEGLDVVAPGGAAHPSNCTVGVISPRAGGSYSCNRWGTSISAPHVSGILALMIARFRALDLDYTPDDLRQILQITATDLGKPGWDQDTGYGLVNAHAAVTGGVPRIFVAKKSGDALTAPIAPVRSQLGGAFYLSGMPEGTWSLFGWVDSDSSGTVSEGDFFQDYGQVRVKKGTNLTVNLVLTRYEGDELTVTW